MAHSVGDVVMPVTFPECLLVPKCEFFFFFKSLPDLRLGLGTTGLAGKWAANVPPICPLTVAFTEHVFALANVVSRVHKSVILGISA